MAPQLETPRLILRSWRDTDVEPWAAMGADERVMRFFPSTYDRVEAIAIVAGMRKRFEDGKCGWWALEIKGGPEFAGVIALQNVPFEAAFTPALEVGWRLAHDQWGNGYATEGARAALDYAFDELGFDEIVAMTAQLNTPSRRVMERLGMTYDSRDDFENPRVPEGHRVRPHVLYRIRSGARKSTLS